MGWDVVQIGLRHDLPVEDPIATNAQQITFSSFFQNEVLLTEEDFVEVIYDDFKDLESVD